jgi:hypothetical protein
MKTQTNHSWRLAGISRILFALFLSIIAFQSGTASPKSFFEGIIKLNPEYKLKRFSNGEVVVFRKSGEGEEVTHKFSDFYADLLMAAYRKQRLGYVIDTFAKKYYLSQEDCRREVKHALNVLEEWNIVIRDESMASR